MRERPTDAACRDARSRPLVPVALAAAERSAVREVRKTRPQSSAPGFLRIRFPVKSQPYFNPCHPERRGMIREANPFREVEGPLLYVAAGTSLLFFSFPAALGTSPLFSLFFEVGYCWSIQALAMPTASARTRAITPTRSVTEIAPRASRILK